MDNSRNFKAMVVSEKNGKYIRQIEKKSIDMLPGGEVLINVQYSSLNYKDALSAIGNKGVTRKYPHTPGIDAAGIIEESVGKDFKIGDKVIVTGFDLGMNTPGGFEKYIRVPAEWIVKLPEGMTLKESMIYGTAGFTAGLSLLRLEDKGMKPDGGEILVTGATGGVGSMSVSILNKAGYNVTAATGKREKEDYLKKIGAKNVISRQDIDDNSNRALLPTRWAGVIDSVGGSILTTAIKSAKYNCSIAACGLTQSPNLTTTVYPFILRGVSLLGIDSLHCPMDLRIKIWKKLVSEWKPDNINLIYSECSLTQLSEKIDLILKGQLTGRVVVNLDAE